MRHGRFKGAVLSWRGCSGGIVLVRVETPIFATESEDAVRLALSAFFPERALQQESNVVFLETDSCDELRQRIWEARIIDTVRGSLLYGSNGPTCRFRLSKQAAIVDALGLPVAPHVLGDILVTVTIEASDRWADAEAWAWWMCPETAEGEIIGPKN